MNRRNSRIGVCAKCVNLLPLTNHHCLPRRFFGCNQSKLMLCDDCHKEIERILYSFHKFTKEEYLKIHHLWLKDKTPLIAVQNERKKIF
jgi:hypothetical protein